MPDFTCSPRSRWPRPSRTARLIAHAAEVGRIAALRAGGDGHAADCDGSGSCWPVGAIGRTTHAFARLGHDGSSRLERVHRRPGRVLLPGRWSGGRSRRLSDHYADRIVRPGGAGTGNGWHFDPGAHDHYSSSGWAKDDRANPRSDLDADRICGQPVRDGDLQFLDAQSSRPGVAR